MLLMGCFLKSGRSSAQRTNPTSRYSACRSSGSAHFRGVPASPGTSVLPAKPVTRLPSASPASATNAQCSAETTDRLIDGSHTRQPDRRMFVRCKMRRKRRQGAPVTGASVENVPRPAGAGSCSVRCSISAARSTTVSVNGRGLPLDRGRWTRPAVAREQLALFRSPDRCGAGAGLRVNGREIVRYWTKPPSR